MTEFGLAVASNNIKSVYQRHPFFSLFLVRADGHSSPEHDPVVKPRCLTLVDPEPLELQVWVGDEVPLPLLWHLEPDVVQLFEPHLLLLGGGHLVIIVWCAGPFVLRNIVAHLVEVLLGLLAKEAVSQLLLVKVASRPFLEDLRGRNFVLPTSAHPFRFGQVLVGHFLGGQIGRAHV